MNAIAASVVEELLQVLTPEAPCGVDLAYDPQFLELELAAKGKPEEQYGTTISPEVLPEWKVVLPLALKLLQRSRDLRIAVPFTRALIHMQGITGFAIGLRLLEQLLLQRWDSVHPQLDPDDDNDPMLRINTLATLCEATVVLRDFKETPLVVSRINGSFCLRDIDIVTGEQVVAASVVKPSLPLIEACFTEMPVEDLEQLYEALRASCASINAIETILTEKVGAAQALNLSALLKVVERARRYVSERMLVRGIGPDAVAPADTEAEALADQPAEPGESETRVVRVVREEITSRADVIRTLDSLCKYYAEYEPSSPVPLLLQRAYRLVDKSFLEILEDLAPDGLNQVYSLSGANPAS